MNIGLAVDGQSERAAIPKLKNALESACPLRILTPVFFQSNPEASPAALAKTCASRIEILKVQGAAEVVVLVDREGREVCPGEFAAEIAQHLATLVDVTVSVVVKNRMFENWLIADVAALSAQPKRFAVSEGTRKAIEPNKADNLDGIDILKRCVIDGSYNKVEDSKKILAHADPRNIAKNSRSFRRFLRCLRHPDYVGQSQKP